MRSSCLEAERSLLGGYSAQFFRTRTRPESAVSSVNPPRTPVSGLGGSAIHAPMSGENSFQSAGGAAPWAKAGESTSKANIQGRRFIDPPSLPDSIPSNRAPLCDRLFPRRCVSRLMAVRRVDVVVLTVAAAAALLAAGSAPQPLPAMTPEAWRADVDVLARELPKRHKNAFHAVSREAFDRAIAELREAAGAATDDEMIVGLARIAAMVGDAHTHLDLPVGVRRLPIAIGLFGDEYRITRASEEA